MTGATSPTSYYNFVGNGLTNAIGGVNTFKSNVSYNSITNGQNQVLANWSSTGPSYNVNYNAIDNGLNNTIGAFNGVNNANVQYNFIGSGQGNTISVPYGSTSATGAQYNSIVNGVNNTITTTNYSSILGGNNNTILPNVYNGAILAGQGNTLQQTVGVGPGVATGCAVAGSYCNSTAANLSAPSLFLVGNGTGPTNLSNAFAVTADGYAWSRGMNIMTTNTGAFNVLNYAGTTSVFNVDTNTPQINVGANTIPTANNTYNLGSSSSYYNSLYVNNINGHPTLIGRSSQVIQPHWPLLAMRATSIMFHPRAVSYCPMLTPRCPEHLPHCRIQRVRMVVKRDWVHRVFRNRPRPRTAYTRLRPGTALR